MGAVVSTLISAVKAIPQLILFILSSIFELRVHIAKFFMFCLISALCVCVFAIGGIFTLIIAVVYVYIALFKKIRCINSNTPNSDCFVDKK